WRVLSLAGAVLLVLTVLVSLAPVIGLKRLGIAASSQRVTARASLAQRLAGTTQIAVAGTLGAAALALGWHLGSIMFGSPGYETANRYAVEGLTGALPLPATNEQIALELARRREAIEALPGVTSAAFGGPVPGGLSGFIP